VEGATAGVSHYGGLFINQNTQTVQNSRAIALGAITGAPGGIALDSVAVQGSAIGQQQTQVTGSTLGIWGDTNQTGGIGVLGTVDNGQGVVGLNNDPSHSAGSFTNYDTTGSGTGGAGVTGVTTSPNGAAVYGDNEASTGGDGAIGVYGYSAAGSGVYGQSSYSAGVLGYTTAANEDGVAAIEGSGSGDSNGIYADTYSADGVGAFIDNAAGGYILVGTVNNDGAHQFDVDGYGDGYYAGDLNVDGAINGGSKNFKIDHPLDPANKYLFHASVESSEMMNIYTGNVTTDGEGRATVQLPDWFEALNRDFRYQLTVMGQFAQAIVADKVANHHFTIRTDKPSVEVSWQVTGVRQDAFANAHRLQVEVEKAPADRGHYLHPELYGAPKTSRISHRSSSWVKHKSPPAPHVGALRAQQASKTAASGKVLLPPPLPRVFPAPAMPKALTSMKAQK
jgi:hypothetical protein